ncbi:hypothetical protein ACJIZ3_005849 [Penstemon smallii]|uniref:RING-type domain-containing protein n=1 Tax=Penstemon smallii TaxID=265156 RepID=A0ABD3S669_9LAMI
MDTTKTIIIFFFFFFLFSNSPLITISALDFCSNSFCSRKEPAIRFPFRLKNLQPAPCGYPGFNLFCNTFNQTLIDLPNSGKFSVQAIDYARQNILLNDPENCLPKRLLELNLFGSPFKGFFLQDFMFFNCTFDYRNYKFNPIGCLSGENYTVFASSSQRTISFLKSRCNLMAKVAVPVQWNYFEPVMTSDLSDNIRLKWGSPRCGQCESRGGRCGFRNGSNGTQIECTNAAHRGIPAFLFLLGFLCFLCSRVRNYCWRPHRVMEFSTVVAPQPTTVVCGLDNPTIESYPKTILGESCRLPKPDDNICSICLCEYMPKETLRSIPECHHCFHSECIDQWLRLNSSCPVCRNSPGSSPFSPEL